MTHYCRLIYDWHVGTKNVICIFPLLTCSADQVKTSLLKTSHDSTAFNEFLLKYLLEFFPRKQMTSFVNSARRFNFYQSLKKKTQKTFQALWCHFHIL